MATLIAEPRNAFSLLEAPGSRFGVYLDEIGDRLNPLLVRESRQVLKSRQFVITFLAMLGFAWLVSLVTVGSYGGDFQFREPGPVFFRKYFLVLMMALYWVVPLGAFRSITSEFVEQTYETLCVTPMTPGTVLWGKVQSAFIQMAVYASALTPFLCFTYLLRGIGLAEMVLSIGLLFFVACGLSLMGLMLGALAGKSAWEILNITILLMGSFISSIVTWAVVAVVGDGVSAASLLSGLMCVGIAYSFLILISIGVATAQLTPIRHRPPRYHSGSMSSVGGNEPAAQ